MADTEKAVKAKAVKDVHELSDKSFAVLEAARGLSGDFTAAEIATKTGLSSRSVNGSLTALAKKGLIVRSDKVAVEVPEGEKPKTVRFITVTDEGMSPEYHAKAAD